MAHSAEPAPAPADVSLKEFESVWPVIVARIRDDLGPRRHALLKEAVPVAAAGGVVTLHLPSHLPFHLEQLRADEELQGAIGSIAADAIGGTITLAFDSAHVESTPEAPIERVPDKDRLLEEGEDETDPAALVVDILGGEIVSE